MLLLNMIICIDFAVERQGDAGRGLHDESCARPVQTRGTDEGKRNRRTMALLSTQLHSGASIKTVAWWRFYQINSHMVALLSNKQPHGGASIKTVTWWRFYQINSHMLALLSNKQPHGGASIKTVAWWRFYQINSRMVAILSKQSHGGASINTAA